MHLRLFQFVCPGLHHQSVRETFHRLCKPFQAADEENSLAYEVWKENPPDKQGYRKTSKSSQHRTLKTQAREYGSIEPRPYEPPNHHRSEEHTSELQSLRHLV